MRNATHSRTDELLAKWKSCQSLCGSRSRSILFGANMQWASVCCWRTYTYIHPSNAIITRPRYLPVLHKHIITYLFLLQNKSEFFIWISFSVWYFEMYTLSLAKHIGRPEANIFDVEHRVVLSRCSPCNGIQGSSSRRWPHERPVPFRWRIRIKCNEFSRWMCDKKVFVNFLRLSV